MSDVNYKELRLTGKIFATGIMSFCGVVSETAMNVTFPTLMNEFGIGTSTVQWITTGYLLILSLVITMSSYLKRNFSTRQLFLIAITLFIVATALCYWSPAFWVLLCGRMLQGIGTGIALPLIMGYIREKKPELIPLYEEIYVKGKRDYWEQLNVELKAYAEALGLPYVRDDDSFKHPFDAPPIVVNYFYHEEVKKSAKASNISG